MEICAPSRSMKTFFFLIASATLMLQSHALCYFLFSVGFCPDRLLARALCVPQPARHQSVRHHQLALHRRSFQSHPFNQVRSIVKLSDARVYFFTTLFYLFRRSTDSQSSFITHNTTSEGKSHWAELTNEFRKKHFLVGLVLTLLGNAMDQS